MELPLEYRTHANLNAEVLARIAGRSACDDDCFFCLFVRFFLPYASKLYDGLT